MRVPLEVAGLRHTTTLLVVCVVAVCALVAGCGRTAPTPVERAGLDREYLSVAGGDTCLLLVLGDDGSFLVSERARDRWEHRPMRPGPEPVAKGTWTSADGRLDLEGDGWEVLFVVDSARVEVPSRSDTLSSLRWVRSSEDSPFSACDLVSVPEFDEFLHPTEGSGSAGY